MAEVSFYVSNGNHDTGYESVGAVFSSSGTTTSLYKTSSVNHKTSLLFQNVNIPQGTTITNARLRIFPSNNNAFSNYGILIYANDVDDAVAPTSGSEFSALGLTTAYLVHTTIATTWNTAKNTNTYYSIGDAGAAGYLKAVIQEVLNRPGWVSGNDLQLILLGATTDDSNTRSIKTYENDPSYAAQLTLWYTLALTVNGEIESSGADFFGAFDNQYPGDLAMQGCELGGVLSKGMSGIHQQEVTQPAIIVTLAPPYASISFTDEADALSIEVGAQISLQDSADAFSITAAFGSFGTIALTDAEDIFTSIPGGQAELSDSLDSFSITGTVEAIATAGLSDSQDTLAIEALPGGLAECSVVDAADLLAITGTPETTGGVNLVDASDPLSIQGMGGIASSGISLQDALDRFSVAGSPEETGVIALMDAQDVFSLMGGKLTRFSTHIIQYQKTRY